MRPENLSNILKHFSFKEQKRFLQKTENFDATRLILRLNRNKIEKLDPHDVYFIISRLIKERNKEGLKQILPEIKLETRKEILDIFYKKDLEKFGFVYEIFHKFI